MIRALVVFSLLVISSSAYANYICSGKVIHLGTSDYLHVSTGFGVHALCNLNEDKCKGWLSLITTAKVSDRTISIYYQRADGPGGDQTQAGGLCHDIGNWVTPSDPVYYVLLN